MYFENSGERGKEGGGGGASGFFLDVKVCIQAGNCNSQNHLIKTESYWPLLLLCSSPLLTLFFDPFTTKSIVPLIDLTVSDTG